EIDLLTLERRHHDAAGGVVPDRADVARAATQSGAGDHGRRDFSARQLQEPVGPHVRIGPGVLRNQRDEIDAVLTEPEDVERPRFSGWWRRREPHAVAL